MKTKKYTWKGCKKQTQIPHKQKYPCEHTFNFNIGLSHPIPNQFQHQNHLKYLALTAVSMITLPMLFHDKNAFSISINKI